MLLVGTLAMVAGDVGAPYLKPRIDRPGLPDRVAWSAWSELGLLEIERPVGGARWARFDAVRQATIHDAPPPSTRRDALAMSLASQEREGGAAAVLDAGDGSLAREALRAGFERVDAFALEPRLFRAIASGSAGASAAEPLGDPRLVVRAGSGRDALAGSPGAYRAVVVAHPGAPERKVAVRPARDALSLAASTRFSVEAIGRYLAALEPEGFLLLHHASDGGALGATALAALRGLGVASPEAHLFACGDEDGTSLVVGRGPLTEPQLELSRRHCKRARAEDRSHAARAPEAAPLTDDRPFFVEALSLPSLVRRYVPPPAAPEARAIGRGLLGAALAVILGALAGAVLVRLREGRRGFPALRAYAASLLAGAGAALLAPAALRIAGLALGHPSRAVLVALPVGFALASGGGLLGLVRPRGAAFGALAALAALAGALVAGASRFEPRSPLAAIAWALAALVPGALVSLLLVRSTFARSDGAGGARGPLVPVAAAGAALGAALGAQLAAPVAAHVGFSASALAGGVALAAASLAALLIPARRPTPAPKPGAA